MYFLLYNLVKSGEKWLIVVSMWVKVVDFKVFQDAYHSFLHCYGGCVIEKQQYEGGDFADVHGAVQSYDRRKRQTDRSLQIQRAFG